MSAASLRVGHQADRRMLTGSLEERRRLLARAASAGIDHLFTADHVSFHTGLGMDGLIRAASMLALDERLSFMVGVYLLALRHPVPVARQLASLAELAPGRLALGVGVGGEDRHEIEICGVDPRTRGRRTDEALEALAGLLTGEPYSHSGEFFSFEEAWIRPRPEPPVPILIGGRAPAALRRAARFGDGWLAGWASPRRFRDSVAEIGAEAERIGRAPRDWWHGLQLWVGVDPDRDRARARLSEAVETMYRLPFERLERYCPYGPLEAVEEQLAPYLEAGCRCFNIACVAGSTEASIDAVGELKRRLAAAIP